VLVDVDHGLHVGLARHAGHGDVRVHTHGGLLVAHDVQLVGCVVADADPDGPGAGHLVQVCFCLAPMGGGETQC
jgi:hypothetical protein